MGFIFESVMLELALGALLLFYLIYVYMTSQYSFWKDRSIAYVEPSFPFGTEKDVFLSKSSRGEYFRSVYMKFRKEKVVGMFQLSKPYLLVRDPELLKQFLTKDFHHFVDRSFGNNDILLPVHRNLFNMNGETWKIMRQKLTPAFTSAKMKTMFFLVQVCSEEFVKSLEPIAERNEKIAIKDYIACLTTDVIASCAFGLESNSIQDPDNEFRQNGKKFFQSINKLMLIKITIATTFPWLTKMLPFLAPFVNGSEDFFLNLVGDTVKYREKNNIVRKDFIDNLIKIKNNKIVLDDESIDNNVSEQEEATKGEGGLTLEEMTAQASLFFVAGFETAASTLSFCLYEIAVNSEVQKKMQKEIDEILIKNNGKTSYQALADMTYMEAVINETLRRYSSLSVLDRQCTEDFKLADLNLDIPKGMNIMIPVYAIHHDPAYYPEPYKFDPERFTDNKITTKNNYTFMPFGEGPRMCIGNRFAMMQMKMCLSMLLHKFELDITEDTPVPLIMHKNNFLTAPASPIILKISKRKV